MGKTTVSTSPISDENGLRVRPKHLGPRGWPLFPKLATAMILGILVTALGLTLLSMQRERQTFQQELERRVTLLLETVSVAGAEDIYFSNVDNLQTLGSRVARSDDSILAVDIYNSAGRVLFATDTLEPGYLLETDPLGSQLVETEGIVYEWQNDRLTAGQAVVVSGQAIGAIHVEYSTAELDASLAAVRNRGLVSASGAAIFGVLLALVVSRSLTRPIQELVATTQEIAAGKLDTDIPVRGGSDEIAVLSSALEGMRVDLKRLYTGLEEQVEERTRELTKALEQAEEANRLKSQFLSVMSHELRTPLNAINGFAQILLAGMTGELNDMQKYNIERIHSNGGQLLSLINDILDISKIEAGHITLEKEPIDVKEWVKSLTAAHSSLAAQKAVGLEFSVDEGMPDELIADPLRLTQMASNLIGNALKFTDEGGVKVVIGPDGDTRWTLRVVDTGVGIPPQALEYIFDEFRQVDSSSTRQHGGTGLGLAIVRRLVLMMGGNVKVESEVGKGSTFTLLLPLETEVSSVQMGASKHVQ